MPGGLGTGDGGGGCDSFGNGQNKNVLNAKMLRLNVDSLPYTTTGNPFDGGTPGLDEIWAYGLRNPWRFSFDRVWSDQMDCFSNESKIKPGTFYTKSGIRG